MAPCSAIYIFFLFIKKRRLQSPCKFAGQINQLRTWSSEKLLNENRDLTSMISFLFILQGGRKDTPASCLAVPREARVQQSGQVL